MDKFKINPSFETPELRQAFEDLIRTTDELRKKEVEFRLSVYKRYIFKGYINLN